MVDETKVEDGGQCVQSATNRCGDSFGEKFDMPSDGSWKQFTIRWTDAAFAQEQWGAVFPWNPQHVTSIQIVAVNRAEPYDFYVDESPSSASARSCRRCGVTALTPLKSRR